MKIGIAAAQTPTWPKMDWVEQAARNLGHDVVRVTSSAELPELLSYSDFVILGHKSLSGRWPNIRTAIKNRQCPIVYWWFDLVAIEPGVPIVEQHYFKQWKPLFERSDVVLVKELSLLDEYREAGVNAHYVDQGCPANMPSVDGKRGKDWDLLVWGQGSGHYHHRVHDVQEAVKQGFKVVWAGASVPGTESLPATSAFELPELASRARCVLSCGRRNDVGGYWSDQFWMATGMGACVARRGTPQLPWDAPFMLYHNGYELSDTLRWARNNPAETVQLGRMARQWVMENHTIEHRIQELIPLVHIAMEADNKLSKSAPVLLS